MQDTKLNAFCISLATNSWLIQDKYLILSMLSQFEMNVSFPGNMITQCEGNTKAV
jgi:hypothetical protein